MRNFIWTECLGCPEIGSVAINSFLLTHKSLTLNVFVYKEDLLFLPQNDRIIYHTFFKGDSFSSFFKRISSYFAYEFEPDEFLLRTYFKKGHKGTAFLWAYILKKFSYCDNFIHFPTIIFYHPILMTFRKTSPFYS